MKRIAFCLLLLTPPMSSLAQSPVHHPNSALSEAHAEIVKDRNPLLVNINVIENLGNNNSGPVTTSNTNQHTNTITSTITHKFGLPEWSSFTLPTFTKPDIDLNIQKHSNNLLLWCNSHKWKLIASATLTIYGYFRYQLNSHMDFLRSPDAWCNWKQLLSLGQIVATPQQDLMQALKIDILKKYHLVLPNKSSTRDICDLFMEDIKREEQILNWYTNFYKLTRTLCLARVYPFGINLQAIAEKKARLEFVTELFSTWYTTQHM